MNKFIQFWGDLALKLWWCPWSKVRFSKKNWGDTPVREEDKATTSEEVKALLKKADKKFKYTEDGFDQLWDAMQPPAQLYDDFISDKIVEDDCDGYHSLIYHCLHHSDVKCYLLVVVARNAGHCTLVCKLEGKWHVADWTTVHPGYDTFEETVEAYNKWFIKPYDAKSDVFYNGLLRFDYKKGKFKFVSWKKGTKEN